MFVLLGNYYPWQKRRRPGIAIFKKRRQIRQKLLTLGKASKSTPLGTQKRVKKGPPGGVPPHPPKTRKKAVFGYPPPKTREKQQKTAFFGFFRDRNSGQECTADLATLGAAGEGFVEKNRGG